MLLIPILFLLGPVLAAASRVDELGSKTNDALSRIFLIFSEETAQHLNDAFMRLSMAVLNESGNKSAVVSPFSVAMALATVNIGARGNTNEEIGKVAFDVVNYPNGENSQYHYPYHDMDSFNVWFKEYLEILNNYTNGSVKIASAIYADNSIDLLEEYQRSLASNYSTKVEKIDFANAPQVERLKINRFVNDTTEGHIPEFLKKPHVSSRTKFIAANAIFMKSNFKQPFSKAQTNMAAFHNADNATKQVNMMKGTIFGSFLDAEEFLLGSIPFAELGFEMMIIVPQTITLETLRDRFIGGSFAWFQLGQKDFLKIHVTLPKFKVKGDYSLATLLKKLGIKDMFTQKADFSGISKAKFHIDDIIHQAVFDLDEEGVNAVAASAVEEVGPVDCKKDCEKTIVADRPFLFAVTYDDVPLFVGQYYG